MLGLVEVCVLRMVSCLCLCDVVESGNCVYVGVFFFKQKTAYEI